LLVTNDSTLPVLIIDGEELVGAKQNRILNTSILLKEHSRTTVPVSCTEQGRWAYESACFGMSDAMLERKIRSRKSQSVSFFLAAEGTHQSDQGEVWEGIQELHAKAKVDSSTAAMNDAFKARQEQLDECLRTFKREEGQVGLLVLINGQPVGFDLVSRPEVYARLHEKLLRSYVLDALLEKPGKRTAGGVAQEAARAFVASAEGARDEVFPSVSYGRDHRYTAPAMVGNALVHDGKLIHAAFLRVDDSHGGEGSRTLASVRRRRRFRE
jgi:hypothetical protein